MKERMTTKRVQPAPTVIGLFAILVLFVIPMPTWAQAKGGGTSSNGNVNAWYDAVTNTLHAVGDTGNNKFLVSLSDYSVSVSSGPTSGTSINGLAGGYVSWSIDPIGFSAVIDGQSGNDTIVVNAGSELSAPEVSISGGVNDDLINVHVSVLENDAGAIIGNLLIDAGKGNDRVNLAMLFSDKPLHVAGDLEVAGGDGNDVITVYDRVFIDGISVFNGGAGRNDLKLSADLFASSLVSAFRSVTFW